MTKIEEMANKIEEVARDSSHMREIFAELKTDVKYIRQTLDGNGVPGLIRQVKSNTEHRISMLHIPTQVKANTKFRISANARRRLVEMAIGAGWLFTLFVLFFQRLPSG